MKFNSQVPPNTILTWSLDPSNTRLTSSHPSHTLPTTTFDVSNQHKSHTGDFVAAFMAAVSKRSRDLRVPPFVGLSSGYDSGAVLCALSELGVGTYAYSVVGMENATIVEERVEYARGEGRGGLLGWERVDMTEEEYARQSVELLVLCEEYFYPDDNRLGYGGVGEGERMDMRRDPGAVGLGALSGLGRRDGALVYMSGTGADEIISDYGFGGRKLAPHSR